MIHLNQYSARLAMRKKSARLLMCVLGGIAGWAGCAAGAAVPDPPPETAALAHEILSHLIAINSTHAHGSSEAAEYVAGQLRAAGFTGDDVQVLTPAAYPTKGNVVARLHGRGRGKPVMYLCHLDVVEAKREDWNFDPFVLTEREGWMYGRGTIDMKGQDAAVLATLIRLKKEGYVPDRDIVVAFTADEEAGGDANGVRWLLREHRSLLDAALVVNPDGGEAALKQGHRLYVAVQTSEKMYLTFALEVTDKGGHSSRPTTSNPIYRLARGLDRLSGFAFPVHVTETTKLYFAGRAQLAAADKKADMLAMTRTPVDAAAANRLSADVETNIMLRTTCVTTLIEGGHAENALPQRARATVQCRVIPGESPDDVMHALAVALRDADIKISVVTAGFPAPDSVPTPAILKSVERVAHSLWPDVMILPEMSAGADDSIYTRALGIPSYGIDGMFDDLDDGRAHGRDERIGVEAFAHEIEFSYRLMKELSKAN